MPTYAERPKRAPLLPILPVEGSKPFSRTKMVCRPPPRSSTPLSPHRETEAPPLCNCQFEWPFWLLVYVMPSSTIPYKVTLLCAYADADDAHSKATTHDTPFICSLLMF